MMRCHFAKGLATVPFLVLLMAPTTVLGADQVVALPQGWSVNTDFFAASIGADATAIALTSGTPDQTRIMQIHGAQVTSTDVSGKVYSLAYSPDGQNLLAHYLTPAGVDQVCLLSASGTVRWTKTDDRTFAFSTTGESIYAWWEEGETGKAADLAVFELNGALTRTVTGSAALDGALAIGDGKKVVLGMGHTVVCKDFTAGNVTAWTYHIPNNQPDISQLYALTPDRILLRLDFGEFKVLTPTGALEYEYKPAVLAQSNADTSESQFRKYDPYTSSTPGAINLFDGSPNGRQVDPTSSLLGHENYNLNASGYTRVDRPVGGRLLFVNSTSVLIRPLDGMVFYPTPPPNEG